MTQTNPSLRRVAVAVVALATVGAAGFYSTSAYFGDSADSGFTLATASPDLRWNTSLDANDRDYDDHITLDFTGPYYPGVTKTEEVQLCNVGDAPLELLYDATLSGNAGIADEFEVSFNGQAPRTLDSYTSPTTFQRLLTGQLAPGACTPVLPIEIELPPSPARQDHLEGKTIGVTFTVDGRTP